MGKFIAMFVLVTAANVIGVLLTSHFIMNQEVPVSYWFALTFIALLTLIVHRMLIGANNKRPQLFVAYFMGALTAKLFFSGIVLVAIGLIANDQIAFTAVAYLIAYTLYTTIEIADLLPRMRNS